MSPGSDENQLTYGLLEWTYGRVSQAVHIIFALVLHSWFK